MTDNDFQTKQKTPRKPKKQTHLQRNKPFLSFLAKIVNNYTKIAGVAKKMNRKVR